ncbi:MAG: V-type ATPase subunit [Spirochaetales bacterium]|nr:V-type ATPase subunit [Spirochaetales bacterium]
MAGPLKKYGFIHAKLRTRISKLLTDEFIGQLIRAHSLAEAVQLFKNNAYSFIEEVYTRTGDLKLVELELFKQEINLYVEIEKHIGDEVLFFVRALASRYEVDNLKNILRLWFDKAVRKRDITSSIIYVYREKIHVDLNSDAVIRANGFSDIIAILKNTPYAKVLEEAEKEVEQKNSIFPAEISLDHYFYRNLIGAVGVLEGRDADIAGRLIGIEIDMQNIDWIVRFKTAYNLPLEDALRYAVPRGYTIDKKAMQSIYESQNIMDVLSTFVRKRYSGIEAMMGAQTQESSSRLILIERILEQITMQEVQKVLLGYPFTIGIILVYFILKRSEIRRLMTILNAKFYSIPEDKIKSRL